MKYYWPFAPASISPLFPPLSNPTEKTLPLQIIEVVLDPRTTTIYRCPPQKRKIGLPETRETEVAISCRLRDDCLTIDAAFRDPQTGTRWLWESTPTRNLRLATQAMLALFFSETIGPRLPTEYMAKLYSFGSSGRKSLERFLSPTTLEAIRAVCPPSAKEVLEFTRQHKAPGIFDPSQARYHNTNGQIAAATRAAMVGKTQAEIAQLLGPNALLSEELPLPTMDLASLETE